MKVFSLRFRGLLLWMAAARFYATDVHAGLPTYEIINYFEYGPTTSGFGDLLPIGDGSFYGTSFDGADGVGAVYKVSPAGVVQTVLRFSDQVSPYPGRAPQGTLVTDGSGNLYGTTSQGGANRYGSIFRYNPTTKAFASLLDFTGTAGNAKGATPLSLIRDSAGNLYGATTGGGASDKGTLFKFSTQTGTLTSLIEFTGTNGVAKGASPLGALYDDGAGNLWGATISGGAADKGTIFKYVTATGMLTTVVEFTGTSGAIKGANPYAPPVPDGLGNFWGTTYAGGASNKGTIFKINAGTGALTTVAEFTGTTGSVRGANPVAHLTSDGAGNFFGTTWTGGTSNLGTVFKINITSGAFTTLVSFPGTTTLGHPGGQKPQAGLVSDGNGYLYGTTYDTVFKIRTSEAAYSLVANLGQGGPTHGSMPYAGLITDLAGNFYGTTNRGGPIDDGTIYKMDGATGALSLITELEGTNIGTLPTSDLAVDSNGILWGTTLHGGAAGNNGTIFKVNPVTRAYTTVVSFGFTSAPKGSEPYGGLLYDGTGGFFYGTASYAGGASRDGTLFKVNASTGALTTLVELTGTGGSARGSAPKGKLVNDGNGVLYGTTTFGGAANMGTVFRFNLSTGAFTTLADFTGTGGAAKGASPFGALLRTSKGSFYGTTLAGGASDLGTVFQLNPSTGEITTLVEFTGMEGPTKGRAPFAGLTEDAAGNLYGTTRSGGKADLGTIFKLDPATGALTTIAEFSGTYGSFPGQNPAYGSLFRAADGNLYGTTETGGPYDAGVIFRLRFGPTPGSITTSQLTGTKIQLSVPVNPNGEDTDVNLEWGTTSSLGNSTSSTTIGHGTTAVTAVISLDGLQPDTTYYVRTKAVNATGTQFGQTLSFTTLKPYPDWKLQQVGSVDAADQFDPDKDGVALLTEYALLLSPLAQDYALLPRPRLFQYPDGQHLRLFFKRDPTRSDVTIEVQAASSPAGPWTTIASSVLGAPTTGSGYVGGDGGGTGVKTVEVRDTEADAKQRFLRIRVTHP